MGGEEVETRGLGDDEAKHGEEDGQAGEREKPQSTRRATCNQAGAVGAPVGAQPQIGHRPLV